MHPIKQMAGGAAIGAVALGLAAGAGSLIPSDAPTQRALTAHTTTIDVVARCAEDDPCWTWSRMGNRRRGVLDLSTGQRVVVGPCTFRHMWLNGNADVSSASERMRGDWWAIHHGCDSLTVVGVHANGIVEYR
jgi:hypothetical protein